MTTTTAVQPANRPASEGLAAELLARRQRKLPAVTAALVLAAMLALGVIGGIEGEKHWGASTSVTGGSAATGFRGFAGRAAGAGGLGRGGLAGGAAAGPSGTVTLIKGTTLYVTDATGNTVLVKTTAGSSVQKTTTGALGSVHPGDAVTVTGTQNGDGSYTARQITIGGTNG
jgi:hypothetical protein